MDILLSGAQQLGVSLTARQRSQFEKYYEALIAANRRTNLTRITGYEEVQVKHFLDSLSIVPVMGDPRALANRKVLDVGSGAGFPGLPVKIALPDMRLTLLEATGKKADFLQEVTALLGLGNVDIISGRAEELGHALAHRESYDFVLSRAVAPMPVLAELVLPLCRIGGRCILSKKGDIRREMELAERAVDMMGGRVLSRETVQLEGDTQDRCLVVIEKVRETPGEYPRRPGIPAKRPIT